MGRNTLMQSVMNSSEGTNEVGCCFVRSDLTLVKVRSEDILEGGDVGTFPSEKQHNASHASLGLSELAFTLGWREVELEMRAMDLRQK